MQSVRIQVVADEDVIRQFIQHNKNNFIETATHIMDGHTEVAPLKYKTHCRVNFVVINLYVMSMA